MARINMDKVNFVSVLIRVHPWLLLLAAVGGCQRADQAEPLWSLTGPTMGTRYSVSIIGGTEAEATQLKKAIDERLAEVNRRMSTYDPESELSRFNNSDSTEWFEVSSETASVVESALKLAESTEGAYDPTVGPLVNLWGFGPGKRRTAPPTAEEIDEAKSSIGFKSVEVRTAPPALRKKDRNVYVDLSSIAKGHGVDTVAELLSESDVVAFMVEIGGEVRTRGTKPGDNPWRIGIEKVDSSFPTAPTGRPLQRVVELVDRSMATSGDYRNFFESDGLRFSHTIDPKTARPVTHDLATVTVQADTCRDADGLATALLVLGPTAGYNWAIEQEVAALFVSRDSDDQLVEKSTPTWTTQIAEEPQ